MTRLRTILIGGLWMITLGTSFLGGAWAYKHRDRIRGRLRALQGGSIIQTNLYNLRVEKLAVPGEGWFGSVTAFEDGVLLVNRLGRFWFIDEERSLHPLALQVPINFEQFEADTRADQTTNLDRFAVKDLIVQQLGDRVRVLASYNYWHSERRCYALRVSAIEATRAQVLSDVADTTVAWRTVYESVPCRDLVDAGDGTRHPTLGAGGRLAALSDRLVLVTVGEFTAEYQPPPGTLPEDDHYGKTMLVDLLSGTARPYTWGHRNAQGLAVAPDGRVWLTEHGPRGGDELNLLIEGRDYGAPHVSYGTQYEMMVWPYSTTQGRHDGFEKPMHVWTPATGISEVLVLGGRQFPWWTGDLLVTSLAALTMHRVRVDEGRVIFDEPITIGHRIRDITETAAGVIVIKTDDDFLIFLDNAESADAEATLEPVVRGELLAGQCRSCHPMAPGAPAGIGNNLWGVVGSRVASSRGFAYSEVLRGVGGTWTRPRLLEFLADPGAFAPGNSMEMTARYTEQQLDDLVTYLETLR